MDDTIAAFNERLQQEIALDAASEGNEATLPSQFVDYMFGVLAEVGESYDACAAPFETRGARASGYELSDDERVLSVFLSDYKSATGVHTLGRPDVETHFKRLRGFVEMAKDGLWRKLEESSPAWDMAQRIAESWSTVDELRLMLLTNAELRTEVPQAPALDGRPVRHEVWDLGRLHKLSTSGRKLEPLNIDVGELWPEPLPCLGPYGQAGDYQAYLLTVPGEFLAKIYGQYGPRLLELNVRSFLQSRGAVNRGIQETIRDEPHRFLAYNNGISMTASAVEVVRTDKGLAISRIDDLQIVNGGRRRPHSTTPRSRTRQICRRLTCRQSCRSSSQVSWTNWSTRRVGFARQNRINMADFTANDPFT